MQSNPFLLVLTSYTANMNQIGDPNQGWGSGFNDFVNPDLDPDWEFGSRIQGQENEENMYFFSWFYLSL
jgi:hypothetical protein